jgi:hypothetical protein
MDFVQETCKLALRILLAATHRVPLLTALPGGVAAKVEHDRPRLRPALTYVPSHHWPLLISNSVASSLKAV